MTGSSIKTALAISAVAALACVTARAQTGFTDSLINEGTLNYVWTPLLYAGASTGTAVSFSSGANGLGVNVSGFSGTAVQGVYFDTTGAFLPVGDMLTVSVNWQTTGANDFGIAVGSNPNPTAADGTTTDTRGQTDYLYAGIRATDGAGNAHVAASGTDGSVGQFALLQAQNLQTPIVSLAIARTSDSTFSIYYQTNGSSDYTLLGTDTFTTSTTVGTTIGFYTDVRGNGTPRLGDLFNLAIVPVPEPSTVAFLGMSVACLAWLRRKF
ncbi:MAG TPA: PEP-CTERM sorting domain-containing protein [Verrucomicrobiae bacterium]|nr:PEP-CTERM sorting domain-containing protein [Verrucomicrobiae bacterium]